jgi:hypothetical protein
LEVIWKRRFNVDKAMRQVLLEIDIFFQEELMPSKGTIDEHMVTESDG